ncbi:MAG: hypothetical protein IPQ03_03010 [Bacteroidetes bacterium]|nr:hypothetical protein [Bacteroidota bacterium]
MKSILKIILFNSCWLLTAKTGGAQTYFELIAGGQGEEVCTEAMVIGSRYVFTGHTTSAGNGSYDVFVLQTDESGNLVHQTILGGPAEDIPLSATLTKDKKIVMTGYTNSFSSDQPFLCKVDTNGALIWDKHLTIGGWGFDVCQADGNNLFMTGHAGSPDPDLFFLSNSIQQEM